MKIDSITQKQLIDIKNQLNKKYDKKSHPACRMAFSLYVFLCIHPQ